jgi:hypothetical protein
MLALSLVTGVVSMFVEVSVEEKQKRNTVDGGYICEVSALGTKGILSCLKHTDSRYRKSLKCIQLGPWGLQYFTFNVLKEVNLSLQQPWLDLKSTTYQLSQRRRYNAVTHPPRYPPPPPQPTTL